MSRIPIELIDRYLAGSSSPEDIAVVEQWLAQSPTHAALMDELRDDRDFQNTRHSRADRFDSISNAPETRSLERIRRRTAQNVAQPPRRRHGFDVHRVGVRGHADLRHPLIVPDRFSPLRKLARS